MKKYLYIALCTLLLITGCAPKFGNDTEVLQGEKNDKKKSVVPTYQISENTYRVILPFKASEARGLVVANVDNRLDMDEFETGLTYLAHDQFPTSKFFYQEGQYLDKQSVRSWLKRKYTNAQLKALEAKYKEQIDNIGLNPIDDEKGTLEERNKRNPIYLSHILEQNFLVKSGDKVKLGGITIGLAMNSVHYYKQEQDYPRQAELSNKEIEAQGQKMAQEIVQRIRQIDGLSKVPIVIGLFKQQPRSAIVPGNFFKKGIVNEGQNNIASWENVDEKYVLFPSNEASKSYRNDAVIMENFKADITDFFPNYTGVIGRGLYRNNKLTDLVVEIPMQFYSKSEVIGFTQYVTGLVVKSFPKEINVSVYISSLEKQEALIVRKANADEPYVHIYK
jgi:protein involved in sex pheromone biosynthesis